jgi:Phage integrase, N-terminal SAM-like domain
VAAVAAGARQPRVPSSGTSRRAFAPAYGSTRKLAEFVGRAQLRVNPHFEEYARHWLLEKIEGTTAPKPISSHTANDYRWRLEQHLLPFFGHYRLDEIDETLCQQFKAKKLRDAAEQRKAIASGAVLRDERNRRIVPLGPSSLRKLTSTVASILQDAVEDKHITHNPARGRRMRVHIPRPSRSFLEIDELVSCALLAHRPRKTFGGRRLLAPRPRDREYLGYGRLAQSAYRQTDGYSFPAEPRNRCEPLRRPRHT